MHQRSGFLNADPAHDGFQYIEDLATAYWYSEVLFTALDLQLFKQLERGLVTISSLAEASSAGNLSCIGYSGAWRGWRLFPASTTIG